MREKISSLYQRARKAVLGTLTAIVVGIGTMFGVADRAPAQSIVDTVSWTMPDHREDGTPMALAEIAATRVYFGRDGQLTQTLDVPSPATTVNIPRTGNAFGEICYEVAVIDVGGLESARSALVCKNVNARPKAPSGLGVK